MMRHRSVRVAALTSAAVIGLSLTAAIPASAGGQHGGGASPTPKVIAGGLDNPRQLSFARSGDLLVAEAGEGGSGPCGPGPEGGTVCFGATGAVTKITPWGKQSRIITGLPSQGGQGTGSEAIGPSDVAGDGHRVAVLLGLGADPATRDALPAPGQLLGTLIQTTTNNHSFRTIADLAAWEAANNPIDNPDSDPSGMLADHGRYAVVDAGGNTLLDVGRHGKITLLASFEDRMVDAPPFLGLAPGTQIPMQAVPTSVAAKGYDGALYVSQLTGFPFPKGAANIYRVDPRTGQKTVYAAGLTNVTDLAFAGRTLYAVQIADNGLLGPAIGSVVKVRPGGTTAADHTTVAGALTAPYGIAIHGHDAYVTTHSTEKDAGQVIRIRLW